MTTKYYFFFSMKRKILHIITGLSDGGAEAVMTRLCISSKKYEHSVISLQGRGKHGKTLEDHGILVKTLGMNRDLSSLVNVTRLPKIIRQEAPDVVQTWMYHADLIGGIAARLARVKKVCWGVRHSSLSNKKKKHQVCAFLCAVVSIAVPHIIICCGNAALRAHAKIGYQRCKLEVIFNGYDISRFYPDTLSRAEIRESLGLRQDEFVLGNVSRFDPNKDHKNLLQALYILKDTDIKFRCLLVGKDMENNNHRLEQLVSHFDLEDSVALGQKTIFQQYRLDVHLSSLSGFPNVVTEAMACGVISVSTNVGDAYEIDYPEETL